MCIERALDTCCEAAGASGVLLERDEVDRGMCEPRGAASPIRRRVVDDDDRIGRSALRRERSKAFEEELATVVGDNHRDDTGRGLTGRTHP